MSLHNIMELQQGVYEYNYCIVDDCSMPRDNFLFCKNHTENIDTKYIEATQDFFINSRKYIKEICFRQREITNIFLGKANLLLKNHKTLCNDNPP